MSYLNSKTLETSKEVIKKYIDKREYVNLPDLKFFHWCQLQYKLNKGVYNSIDTWFYDYGIISIIHRRIYILAFLEFVTDVEFRGDHHKYIRFGNGGLTRRLQQFMKKIENKKSII